MTKSVCAINIVRLPSMRTSSLIASFVLLVCECTCFAATESSAPQWMLEQAFERLCAINCFAFGGVGYAGTTSEGELAFRSVAASTNSLELFTAALTNGTIEAKMYALCGIRRLSPQTFDIHAIPFAKANEKVTTMSGCIVIPDRASNIVVRIKMGLYDTYVGTQKTKR